MMRWATSSRVTSGETPSTSASQAYSKISCSCQGSLVINALILAAAERHSAPPDHFVILRFNKRNARFKQRVRHLFSGAWPMARFYFTIKNNQTFEDNTGYLFESSTEA